MERRLINIKQLSEYIAMPVPTIYTYVSTGKIPLACVKRIGRALKFDVAAVDNWLTGAFAAQANSLERK